MPLWGPPLVCLFRSLNVPAQCSSFSHPHFASSSTREQLSCPIMKSSNSSKSSRLTILHAPAPLSVSKKRKTTLQLQPAKLLHPAPIHHSQSLKIYAQSRSR